MKTRLLFFFVVVGMFGCSTGIHKDLKTGLTYKFNGFSIEDVSLVSGNDILQTSAFPFLSKITMFISGLENVALKEGKVYIGCEMVITDEQGVVILQYDDLYKQYDETGIAPEDARNLSVSLTVGDLMKIGNFYTWKVKVWDKSGEGVITAEIKFSVVSPEEMAEITIIPEGLSCTQAYLTDEQSRVINSNVSLGKNVTLLLLNTEGFQAKDNKVYPGGSLSILNETGDTLFHHPNLLEQYTLSGVSPEEVEKLSFSFKSTAPMAENENYVWHMTVWDAVNQHKLYVMVDLFIH